MLAFTITSGQYAILGTLIAGIFVVVGGLISVKRTVTRTEGVTNTIEVNTNARLSTALTKIDTLEATITRLVEALAVAQESPAQERKPVPVQVIDPQEPPVQ